MKTFLIVLLVWLAPGVLLFLHLAWKNQLLARFIGSTGQRTDEQPLGDVDQETSPQAR